MAKPTEGASTSQYKGKKCEHWPTEAGFLSCGPENIKENAQYVHHELQHVILHV